MHFLPEVIGHCFPCDRYCFERQQRLRLTVDSQAMAKLNKTKGQMFREDLILKKYVWLFFRPAFTLLPRWCEQVDLNDS